jgi:dihydroxyacetone kinase
MDGTSGALYSIFFNALARGIRSAADSQGTKTADAKVWAEAFSSAKDSFYNYTRGSSSIFALVPSFLLQNHP